MTKQEIYKHITGLMVELFEVNAEDIKPESRLQEDLDIDSIDAVDLLIELKPLAGKKVAPEDFREVRTVQDVVDAIVKVLESSDEQSDQATSQDKVQ